MGDPKRQRKKYVTPRHLWRTERIEEETRLRGEYGLRTAREVWIAKTLVSKFRRQARNLLPLPEEERREKARPLLMRLYNLGILEKDATINDVLNLTVEDILNRRLQTLVYKLGLAKTINMARQMIVHGHILVNGRKARSPGRLIKRDEEKTIMINPRSPFIRQIQAEA